MLGEVYLVREAFLLGAVFFVGGSLLLGEDFLVREAVFVGGVFCWGSEKPMKRDATGVDM